MNYATELELHVVASGSDDDFDQDTDELFEALGDVADVMDVDMSVNVARRTVWLHVTADAADPVAALATVHTAVRTAIHATGGRTPGWDDALRRAATRIDADSVVDGRRCADARAQT